MEMNHMRKRPGFSTLLLLLACVLVLGSSTGCDMELARQFFDKTFIDPSQPIYSEPTSTITELQESLSIYDKPEDNLPANAEEPTEEDLKVIRADYRVAPTDKIEVTIFELRQLNADTVLRVRVTETGSILLPKLPAMRVVGMTEAQIRDKVAQEYRDTGVLQDPLVTVVALTRVSRVFGVSGAFAQPGTYNILRDDFRLRDAMTLVGGVTDPNIDWIYVIRTEEEPLVFEQTRPANGGPATREPADEGPGTMPLELPGAPGNGGQDGQPDASADGESPSTPANGGAKDEIPSDLKSWTPDGSSPPPPPEQGPGVQRNGLPESTNGNGSSATPYGPGQGHWMVVDGKWKFIAEAPRTQSGGQAASAGQQVGPRTRVVKIDLEALRSGDGRYNIVIRNQDIVLTPRPVFGEFYIMGNINRPGVYSLTNRKITITQAVAAAGGFGPLAVPSRVQLIRRIDGDTKAQMFTVDVGKIFEGKQNDIVLKPNDIVNVGTAVYAPFLAVIRNAFRATYGVGFVYDRNIADVDRVNANKIP